MRAELKRAVAQLECESGSIGTAFLVDEKRAITARHTIDEHLSSNDRIFLNFLNQGFNKSIEAKVIFPREPYVGLDIAILEINEEVPHIIPLKISSTKVEPYNEWEAYGFSNTRRAIGEVFTGTVKQIDIPNFEDGKYDLDLACLHPQIIDTKYETRGASGSPIFIKDRVVGVLSDKVAGGTIGGVSILSCLDILKKELGIILHDNDSFKSINHNYSSTVSPSNTVKTTMLTTLQLKIIQAKETIIELIKDFPIDSHSVLYQRLDEVVETLNNLSPSEFDNYLKQFRFPLNSTEEVGLEQLIEIIILIKCKFPETEFVFNDQTANLCVDSDQDYYNLLVYAVRRHTKMPEVLLEIVRDRLKTPSGKKAVQRGEVILPYPIIMDNCSGHKKVNLCKNCQSEFSFENIIKNYCTLDDEGYFSGIEKNNLGLLQEIKVLCANCLRDLHNEVDDLDELLQRIEEMVV